MCHAGGASEVGGLRFAVSLCTDYTDRSVSGLGPALTEIRPDRIWAVLRRSERCEAQWLRRMLGLDGQAARPYRAAGSNGLRIRQFDGQVPALRGSLRWSTQFRALFVRARRRTGDRPQHVGLLDLFGPPR